MLEGLIEVLTPHFAQGWALADERAPARLIAECNGEFLGMAAADVDRDDLKRSPRRQAVFLIDFSRRVEPAELEAVIVRRWDNAEPISLGAGARIERREAAQVFILGAPRSGTSELAATLAAQLSLPWVGEGHVAPAFAAASTALDAGTMWSDPILQSMSRQSLADMIQAACRRTYYLAHLSASFIDKTPGIPMLRAAPFLQTCFPGARYIFMRRNGISNVLSRQAKFGGDFGEHCQDWAGAMLAWEEVKPGLESCIEVEQEQMLSDPASVAAAIAAYLQRPDLADAIAASLCVGTREKTGAGIGRSTLADTSWSDFEIQQFREYCGPTMARWGYRLD